MHVSKNQIKLVRSLRLKKYRDEMSLFVAEGPKCVSEMLRHFQAEFVVSCSPFAMEGLPKEAQLEATEKEIAQMSVQQAPQGTIGVFHMPERTFANELATDLCSRNIVLALDGVQDPGNMGTIIRTADWFGVRHIVCSTDTADAYNPKTVQATMGALTRVQIYYTDLHALLTHARQEHIPVYGTLLNGESLYNQPLTRNGIILMGNEGKGISESLRPLISTPLLIPSYPTGEPTSESLNVAVATAVVLAEFRRSSK